MTHGAAFGGRGSGNESGDGFFDVGLDVFAGFLFRATANFANHNDGIGFGILVEHTDGIGLGSAVDGIAANADAGALAVAALGELPNGFVGKRSRTGDHSDTAGFVDITRHDADLALAGGDDAGAIGTNQAGFGIFKIKAATNFSHVAHGNALGDANHQWDFGFNGLEDRVARKGGWDVNDGNIGTMLADGLGHGVADGHFVFPKLTTFARGYSGNNVGAVFEALFAVKGAGLSGDALNDKAGIFVYEDAHVEKVFGDLGFDLFRDDLCGLRKAVGGGAGDAALLKDGLARFDVSALEADDEGHLDIDVAGRGYNTACNDVAFHDPSKDIDQNAFDLGIGQNDFKSRGDLVLIGATADVEEVGGFAAAAFNDIHRRHR